MSSPLNLVYMLHLPGERARYVGMTTIGADARLRKHRRDARARDIQRPVLKWIRKHGKNVQITPLKVFAADADPDLVYAVEQVYIAVYRMRGFDLLNIADGGRSPKQTEEIRRRISVAKTGKKIRRNPLQLPPAPEIIRAVQPKGNHTRWHTNRGLINPDCHFCTAVVSLS